MDASKLHARAEEAIKKKNFDYAIDLLKNSILSIYPDDVKARELLRGCVKIKHKEKGKPSAFSAKAGSMGAQAKIAVAKVAGKWDSVMQECENILLLQPENKGVIYTLAIAAGNAGYIQTAISQHESCLKVDPRFKDSLAALGYLYESQEELQKSLEYFQAVNRIDATDGDAARKVKEISAKMTSATYNANRGKHSRNLQKDADKGAELEFEEKQLRTKEDFLQAIAYTQKKIEEGEEDNPDRLHRKIGEFYAKIGDWKNAVEAIEKALEINPTNFDATVALGDTKIAQYTAKLKKYTKAAAAGDAEAKKKAKAQLQKLNDFKVGEYQRRVDEHPTDVDQRYFLGQVLHQAKRYGDAIEHLQRGTKSPRYKMSSYNLLGECFFETGEANLAVKQYRKALESVDRGDRNAMSVLYNLGMALQASGDAAEAIKTFETLLEEDVNYKDVKKKLQELRS